MAVSPANLWTQITNTMTADFWTTLDFEQGAIRRGVLAGQVLEVRREAREWLVAVGGREEDDHEPGWRPVEEAALEPSARVVFENAPKGLRVVPLLPDRSLVVRPHTEVRVPPGQSVSIFVSAPLWVGLDVGDPQSSSSWVRIHDAPVDRPPDTWFGDSTRTGELCYAGRTVARLQLENVVLPPERALTEVAVRNRSERLLSFSRLRLPLPHLPLYRDERGAVWTEPAELVSDEGSLAHLEIRSSGAWREGKQLVSPSRIAAEGNDLLGRTLGLFFRRSEFVHGG